MVRRGELLETVTDAVDHNADVIITLSKECNGKLRIPVGAHDKIAMEILEFIQDTHEDITIRQMEEALQAAMWWLTTTSVL